MISKKNKITSILFKKLFQNGVFFDSTSFSLRYYKQTREDFGVAVVVSKKISGKAVERNYIKRRFFSIISQNIPLLHSHASYIFYPKKEVVLVNQQNLEHEIKEILSKIHP